MKKVQPLMNVCLVAALVIAVVVNHNSSKMYAHPDAASRSIGTEGEAPVEQVMLTPRILADLGCKEVTYRQTAEYVWELDNGVTVYSSVPYAGDIKGFAGTTPFFIAVNDRNIIVAVAADENRETPEFWYMAVGGELLKRWDGMSLKEVASRQVDVVSGATMSSEGVINTVKETVTGILAK
ncbi:MAG: FMN-binding protein [Bacteroides sp.]|nr:FMN-binding protein [Bacteroides sp.]